MGPKLHERHSIVSRAEKLLERAVMQDAEELTFAELTMVLLRILADQAALEVRDERKKD
jgi:hypothetical protein